jgi:hypothetical protein
MADRSFEWLLVGKRSTSNSAIVSSAFEPIQCSTRVCSMHPNVELCNMKTLSQYARERAKLEVACQNSVVHMHAAPSADMHLISDLSV